MAQLFYDDCSSLDNWTICTDEGHVHYGELFADGDCIYITQENINNNYYDSRQDFYQDCLIGLQDFILEAQIKYEYSKPQREQVASITLYNTENSWERIGFTICPNIDYSGTKGSLYCTNAGSFTFSQNLNYTDDILTYKLCRTGNVLDLYINDIKRGTYENSEIGLVNISGININLGKSRLTDESSLKIPAIYDIKVWSMSKHQFAHGSGTEADPYQVWTAEDLDGVRDYLDAHFIQMADIDLSGVEWVSIAESGVSFQGVYNGNGYLIKNINNPLFGFTQYSTIKKLGLTDVNITSAPLVNVGWGNIIEECFSTGIITSDTALQGGLLGFMQGWPIDDSIVGDIKNCYSRCKIVNTAEAIFTGDYNVGVGGLSAIAGWTFPMREISNCYYAGEMDIYDNESEYIGGIIGYTYIFPTTEGYDTCYYDTTLSGMVDTGKGTPKTTAQMKSEATYDGWDFTDIWAIDPAINDGYPYLRAFSQAEPVEPIIDDVIPSYPPASYIKLQFQAGDSELYDMGIFYTDKTRFRVGDPGAKVNARNSVGKYLRDQSFDERNNYSVMRLDDLLKKILIGAGITDYYVAANSTQLGMQFAPNKSILDGIEEILAYAPGWVIREEVTGRVVIGPKDDAEFTQPSRYTFQRDRDIFSREQIKDDQLIYGRVCVHTTDFVVKVYRAVTSALGWLPPAQKTYYQVVPDGTTSQEAAALATELADAMADSGEVETFVCPFRPQIIPGDEAEILDSDGATFLGVITQVTHSFGAQGFFSEIVVDSGGRIGRPRFKDLVNALQPLPASKRL